MDLPATLSRDEFNRACQAFIQLNSRASGNYDGFGSWTWTEHKTIPSWGHLTRASSSKILNKEETMSVDGAFSEAGGELLEDEDDSCAHVDHPDDRVYFYENIAWHPTYMVPTYYFQTVDSGGTPISLAQIIRTTRFRRRTLLDMAIGVTAYSVQPSESSSAQFPLISQGDHPILGTPHWYFHPCETAAAVKEILGHSLDTAWDSNRIECLLQWFKAWLAVLTTAIDLSS